MTIEILFWIIIFVASTAVLIKGADWLLRSSERIGLAVGFSPIIVGIVIVGAGTSFPELISSIIAAVRGVSDLAAANAIGSNIANILLVAGIGAIVGKQLVVKKNIIDLDLPLLAISTVIFGTIVWDREITVIEGVFLIAGYVLYLLYTIVYKDDEDVKPEEAIPGASPEELKKSRVTWRDVSLLGAGIIGLSLGANYLVESVIHLSATLNIATGVIAATAVAVGTSMPEIIVSAKSAMQKNGEIALGNILGSNIFNMFVVVGVPAFFGTLTVDPQTFAIGIPFLGLTTLLLIISGISRRIHLWEGTMFLLLYVLFAGKIFGAF